MTLSSTDKPWITRFAPSPTGILHLGNVRTAVLNALLAKKSDGLFLLRLEDTDQERSCFTFEASLLWSLAWLGLVPDQPVRHQSLRLDAYAQAVAGLYARGRAYPCFCSETDLEQARQQASAAGNPPRYSGTCAALSAQERKERMQAGEPHVMRFCTPADRDVHFQDLIKGPITVPTSAFGDFVLLRSSGWPSYNLAVVVDDRDMGVTLVLRGEDHLTNTARQILLYEALDAPAPRFAHHGLLVDREGKKLSKRSGALGIPDCMQRGLEPLAVVHYLAALSGSLSQKKIYADLDAMAQDFNPRALGRGNAVMSLDELEHLSARYFRATEVGDLCARVHAHLPATDPWHSLDVAWQEALVASVRDTVANVRDLCAQLVFFTQPEVAYTPAVLEALHPDHAVLQALDDILAAYNQEKRLSMDEAGHVFRQVATVTKIQGRALYHPIRLALTGTLAGPELTALMTLLPVSWLRQRLSALVTFISKE
ncbi:glutamate--tRNA ligase [Desulfovibrionales bacterium]